MIRSRRVFWIVGSAVLLVSLAVTAIVLQQRRGSHVAEVKPLTRLRDGVFYISPDDYVATVKQLIKPNAVFLPAPQKQIQFPQHTISSEAYLGPEKCRECHAAYVDSAEETAHYKTFRLTDASSTPDSFGPGQNVLLTSNPDMHFEMSKKDRGFYQSLFVRRPGESYVHTCRIDFVSGSAKYGQTFLYWEDQCLYELPVSHFSEIDKWVNSPGYVNGVANFARPISPRCVECHTTRFEQFGKPFNRYNSERAVLGVTCEKCHGPGREHVEYHQNHPTAEQARHIVNPASFAQDRALDLCSLCHSGVGESIQEPFSYRPGERLADYVNIPPDTESGPGGVHSANQKARMALSRCFQESSDMRCTTCHNPHQQERGNADLFVRRCLACHEAKDCGVVAAVGQAAEERCIDCHMPQRADSKMPMQGQQDTFHPKLRDHHIRVWDDVTKEILQTIAPTLDLPRHGPREPQQ